MNKVSSKAGDRNKEVHDGQVRKIEEDLTFVELVDPNRTKYERSFSTEFLRRCGFLEAGEGIRITSIESVVLSTEKGPKGIVITVIEKTSKRQNLTATELKKIFSGLDMEKVREKFPPAGRPSNNP